jgi:F-box protein, helicase, 18
MNTTRHPSHKTMYKRQQATLNLTDEQETIMRHAPRRSARIIAFAGTGKSTTLAQYAAIWPEPSLYLAFNANIAKDAAEKLPSCVTAQTVHSLAYKYLNIRAQAHRLCPSLNIQLIKLYARNHRKPMLQNETDWLMQLLFLLQKFFESAETNINEQITSQADFYVSPELKQQAADIADAMINYQNHDKPICHDQYLKRYQFVGQLPDNIRYIMIDEAQDLNPVIIKLLEQSQRPLMIVGDPWQSIYGYRGSINALDSFGDIDTYYLSQSFRFGPEIATLANNVLAHCTKRPDKMLRGHANLKTQICPYISEPQAPLTWIGRTNKQLLETILGFSAAFSLGSKVEKLLEHSCDSEWSSAYHHSLKHWLNGRVSKPSKLRNHFTTCHASKGLEWQNVGLLDDFVSRLPTVFEQDKKTGRYVPDEELHLLYVAITRAQKTLYLPASIVAQYANN